MTPQLCPPLPCVRDRAGGPVPKLLVGPTGVETPELLTCVSCTLGGWPWLSPWCGGTHTTGCTHLHGHITLEQ